MDPPNTQPKTEEVVRKVSFATKKRVHMIRRVPEADRYTVWYGKEELGNLHEKDRMDVMRYQIQFGMMGHAVQSDRYTIRGLEQYFNGLNHVIAFGKTQRYIRSVVQAYKWQADHNQINVEKLGAFASSKSRREVKRSQNIGTQDAFDAYGFDKDKHTASRKKRMVRNREHETQYSPSKSSAKRFLPELPFAIKDTMKISL
ncbi:expressed unknown protein [Seminavis robusta]|uniref:Uncharacterized protein n=1 Tax=Seminavis robusta TaxID=568900 RepID=A0A9N8DKV0_9STRA|nr:expressed unknown protein [Seminavis robusta]|eukprot:Sro198_g083970.1 n/a (201) ;mRNA; f:8414-9016